MGLRGSKNKGARKIVCRALDCESADDASIVDMGCTTNPKERNRLDSLSADRVTAFFEQYCDCEIGQKTSDRERCIGPDGISRLCGDLEIDPEDLALLVLAWHLKAKSEGFFSESEFSQGMSFLRIDSLQSLKEALPRFRGELETSSSFKDIYRFSFFFCKEDPQNRAIDLETAALMLRMLMRDRSPFTEAFCSFVVEQTSYRGINLDQWMSFLEFSRSIKPNFGDYDENGPWPVLFDEFVAWSRPRQPQGAA